MPLSLDRSAAPARALAIYTHPDDPEVSCAGTLARWVDEGAEVRIVICTAGEKGTVDPDVKPAELAEQRAKETAAAAEVLGIAGHVGLDYPDGEIANDLALREQLVTLIRQWQPTTVVTSDPTAVIFGDSYVNHHDHRVVGFGVLDACAPAAARPLYFPDAGPPHQVESIYLSGTLVPDHGVDITSTVDRKVRALACHRSQLGDDVEELGEVVRARASADGAEVGVAFAETFRILHL